MREPKSIPEMIAVMQAFAQGSQIEFYGHSGTWKFTSDPVWNWYESDYRIKENADFIDWDQISNQFKYMARDKDDELPYLYERRPCIICDHWSSGGHCAEASVFKSYVKGDSAWDKSLVVRPGHD